MMKLNVYATRAMIRLLSAAIDDYVIAFPTISQPNENGTKCRGGLLSRERFAIAVVPKSVFETTKFRELLRLSAPDYNKGYITKENCKKILGDYAKYIVTNDMLYSDLEGIESEKNNNGFRFQELCAMIWGGAVQTGYNDVVLKQDVLTAQKRARKQCKFCGFSAEGRLNKRQSYSSFNWTNI
jgi:hypothetical protein